MFSTNDFYNHIDYLEEHEDYMLLKEEHAHTEIYKEIIDFMYLAFPEWTTNAGIGKWAPEFVLDSINDLEYLLYDDEGVTFKEAILEIYLTLVHDYKRNKSLYSVIFAVKLDDRFMEEYDKVLTENEHILKPNFSAFFDMHFKAFSEKELKKVTYNFNDEDDLPGFN